MSGYVDHFGRLSGIYKSLEWATLGSELEKMRFSFLEDPQVQKARQILILGEGDGRFLRRALELLPETHFTVLDASFNMISKAQNGLTHEQEKRTKLVCEDALKYTEFQRGYDGLVMHCFLDCFTPQIIEKHLPYWLRGVKRDGWVWIGDFVEPPNYGWQWVRLRILYAFFGWVTNIEARAVFDVHPLLANLGWKLGRKETFAAGALSSRLFQRTSKD